MAKSVEVSWGWIFVGKLFCYLRTECGQFTIIHFSTRSQCRMIISRPQFTSQLTGSEVNKGYNFWNIPYSHINQVKVKQQVKNLIWCNYGRLKYLPQKDRNNGRKSLQKWNLFLKYAATIANSKMWSIQISFKNCSLRAFRGQ